MNRSGALLLYDDVFVCIDGSELLPIKAVDVTAHNYKLTKIDDKLKGE